MKVFTQVGQKDLDQVKPENINDNTRMVVGEFNGKIDGQNFPVETIDKFKLKAPTLTSTSTANVYGFRHIGQTQDYYFIRRWNNLEQGLSIHNPVMSFNLHTKYLDISVCLLNLIRKLDYV